MMLPPTTLRWGVMAPTQIFVHDNVCAYPGAPLLDSRCVYLWSCARDSTAGSHYYFGIYWILFLHIANFGTKPKMGHKEILAKAILTHCGGSQLKMHYEVRR